MVVGFVVAERVMYIPLIGFSILIGNGIHIISTRAGSSMLKSILNVTLWIVFILFGVKNSIRNSGKNSFNAF